MPARRGIDISVDELMAIREEARKLSWQDLLIPDVRQLSQGLRLTESRGMEYRESRAYVVGDEFRSIDWRALARSGEAYTKIYSDQLEHTAMIAIDLSPSVFFGSSYSFKSWSLARLGAVIGWLCERSQLPIECLLISQKGLTRVPLGIPKRNLPRLFSALSEQCHYDGPGNQQASLLNQLLAQSSESLRPGSMFFLLSDCLGVDDNSVRLFGEIARRSKAILGRISDQTETTSWPRGSYPLAVHEQTVHYQQASSKQPTALDILQTKVEQRINRFSAMASSQLLLSCNRDLGAQLRESLVSNHDAR